MVPDRDLVVRPRFPLACRADTFPIDAVAGGPDVGVICSIFQHMKKEKEERHLQTRCGTPGVS